MEPVAGQGELGSPLKPSFGAGVFAKCQSEGPPGPPFSVIESLVSPQFSSLLPGFPKLHSLQAWHPGRFLAGGPLEANGHLPPSPFQATSPEKIRRRRSVLRAPCTRAGGPLRPSLAFACLSIHLNHGRHL